MKEKHSCHDFEVQVMPGHEELRNKWCYLIFTEACQPYDDGIIDSEEWFDTEQEARFAAIGHIDLLENGAGQP